MFLDDINICRLLFEKEDETTKYYRAFLFPTALDLRFVLENIKILFSDYPDHGIGHSIRVLNYIDSIINETLRKSLSSLDIVVLIFSALFHDTGMIPYHNDNPNKNELRKRHHELSKNFIDTYFDKYLPAMEEHDRIKNAVVFLCEAHGMTLEALLADKRFNQNDCIRAQTIHYGILAFLLRIGDLMDIESIRTNSFRMTLLKDSFDEISYAHNERHFNVSLYEHNPSTLKIIVIAENCLQYKIWDDWLTFLKNDIEKFNAIYARDSLCFPILTFEINKPDGANYTVQSLRFEIDESGGMWDILSKAVYTNELDFLRELLQNAIDASLKQVYIDEDNDLKYPSPRGWGNLANPITVGYSEITSTLFVIDAGIGMNTNDLKSYLFKVSCSGQVKQRQYAFPGIAQFGIGFISCLINADNISIYTSSDSKEMNIVTLESDRNYAFIERCDNVESYIGTAIVLHLKHSYSYRRIESYISSYFVYPSVSIRVINLDKFEKVIKNTNNGSTLMATFKKAPFMFNQIYNKVVGSYNRNISRLSQRLSVINQTNNCLINLKKWVENNIYDLNTLEKNRVKYNEQLSTFLEILGDGNILLTIPTLNLPTVALEDEYYGAIEELYDNFSKIEGILEIESAKCRGEIDINNISGKLINNQNISSSDEWKYFVAYLDNNLDTYKMIKTKTPISLEKSTGILLIKHIECDYSKGIEYEAINGFLFHKGVVCKNLALLRESVNNNEFVVGLNGLYKDIREEIEARREDAYFDDEFDEEDFDNNASATDEIDYYSLSPRYDEISIIGNKIVRNYEKLITGQVSTPFGDVDDDGYTSLDYVLEKTNLSVIEQQFMEIITTPIDCFYQDGIAIPWNISHVFPMGFFRIRCNLTADSRMKLNVTRHEPSEISGDVDNWVTNVAGYIQKSIMKQLEVSLKDLNLYATYEELLWNQDENEGVFREKTYTNMKKIIREKR